MSIVLGIMSGTSLDGADYALCEIYEGRVTLCRHWHIPFPAKLRARLSAAAANRSTTYELAQLHHDLGRFYAQYASIGLQKRLRRIDCIGLHGQTVFHDAAAKATLQIGEPAWLAAELGVPVINNFRAGDLALGGQGAPLATIFHEWVFAERGRHICINNLGGISNVTSLDWRKGSQPRIIAFDTGPANMLMDLAVATITQNAKSFDRDGRWGRRGKPDERLVSKWLRHPFFRKKPPKSTGREVFGEPFLRRALSQTQALSKFDLLATLTEFTALSIALNYSLHLPVKPDRVILCGGGGSNSALVDAIRRSLETKVVTCDSFGWPAQAIEPAAFALLAWLRINGRPGNIPATTGAKRSALLGQVTMPGGRARAA
jgi:anhydro-N-acetylmuramic acid kinase